MKFLYRNIIVVVLMVAFVVSYLGKPTAGKGRPDQAQATDGNQPSQAKKELTIQDIEAREKERNGITVGKPKVYDDALLQQMLQQAEARLATLQLIDQTGIAKNIGATSGASQQISSFGLNVQGAPVPGVTITEKSPASATALATRDVQTTNPQINPPTATAPTPTTTLPSSFSASASNILNEQMQLTAEIQGLRLLLEGALSDFYAKCKINGHDDPGQVCGSKHKTTIGFPISLDPRPLYKSAVAIVEVEVEKGKVALSDEPPAITSLLPLEKTYNVASITDKSVSLGGGVATQILGVSGSWIRGHKTYYVVQDQDTLALSYQPEEKGKVGFLWQFRPVLGQEYVKAGLKHTFVQLAFAVPPDAGDGEIGKVTIRTYWRKYDRKKGVVKEVIPDSIAKHVVDYDIPRFTMRAPGVFNARDNLEYLGGGQMLVTLPGRFLSRTYVRIGATLLEEGPRFIHRYEGIQFIAPISDLANRGIYLARDGHEVPLKFSEMMCSKESPIEIVGTPQVTVIDEGNSKVEVTIKQPQLLRPNLPALVIVIGDHVFGYPDSPIERNASNGKLTAIVPTALLRSNPEVTITTLFAPKGCSATVALTNDLPRSQAESLTVFAPINGAVQFLLNGHRLNQAQVLLPQNVALVDVGKPGIDSDTLRLVTLTDDQLKNHKFLLLQKNEERPFLVAIPGLDPPKKPDPPKARERITLAADEVVIEGEGMKELEKVNFKNKPIPTDNIQVAADGKSVKLTGLKALGVTATATTQTVELVFKSGKVSVKLEVISAKVETVPK